MTGTYTPGRGFTDDPRLAMARALIQQGASTAPVQSPLEGLARALQGGVGGWVAGNAKRSGQEGRKAAMAIMGDATIPMEQRYNLAGEAYSKADPVGQNPIESLQMQAMAEALKQKKAESPLGKLYDDMQRLPPDHPVRKIFETAMAKDGGDPAYLRRSEAAKGQGGYDAKIEGEPALINATAGPQADAAARLESAKNPALIARTGGQAQATANVDLRMKPQIGAATIAAETPGLVDRAGRVSAATAEGSNRGEMAPVQTPAGPMPGVQAVAALKDPTKVDDSRKKGERDWRSEFKPSLNMAEDLVKQRNIIKTAVAKGDGTGDIAAITAFNKLLDPGAVVREADVTLTLAAQGVADRLGVWMQNKKEGDILPPELRRRIGELADQIYTTSANTIKQRVMPYKPVIERDGYSFGNIIPEALQKEMGWLDAAPVAVAPPVPTAGYAEGSILTGPNGEKKVLRGGEWVDPE